MHRHPMNRFRPASLWSALTSVLALLLCVPAAAQSHLTLDAKFAPATAAPGDIVTLTVALQIEPGWHVYGSKDEGPVPTVLAFKPKGLGGLVADGRLQFDAGMPHRAAGVTNYWVVGSGALQQKFKVPANAAGGVLTVAGTVEYMACNEEFCDPPASDAFTAKLEIRAPAGAPAAAPAGDVVVKDAKLTVRVHVEPASPKPGDKVQVTFAGEVVPGWHVYGSKEETGIPIGVTFAELGPLAADGALVVPPGEGHAMGNETSYWLAGKFELRQTLVVPADAAGGAATLRGTIDYMVCDKSSCLPPAKLAFALPLAIAGGAPAAAPETKGAPPPVKTKPPAKLSLRARVEPSPAHPGEQVKLLVDVTVDDGWHVYGSRESASVPTTLAIAEGSSLQPSGDAVVPPGEKHEIASLAEYRLAGTFTIEQALAVPKFQPAGKVAIPGTIHYEVCNESGCLDPADEPFTTEVVVEAGAVRAAYALPASDGNSEPGSPQLKALGIVGDGKLRAPKFAEDGAGEMGGSLWSLILLCIGGGLIALVMPCTYPMIPITFSFFTKQADKRGGKVLPLALAYGAGIVLIFVVVGVAVGEVIGPFAAHWATNLVIGGAFVVFALSLFGCIDLRPPAFLTNAAGKASTGGGLLGVFLMGATLVITSFTCTAPIVGSLLAGVARNETSRLDVGIGMAAFGLTMAAPFVFLALLPGRVKALPRSGEWMNTLKVTLGFVEIAAALKFLSNVDIALGLGVMPREVFLFGWAFVFALLALFLFGLFRCKGEPLTGVSTARNASGIVSLLLATYCAAGGSGLQLDYVMTAFEPNYQLRELREHEIVLDNHTAAMEQARHEHKYVLVNFTGFT
jgi:thiol:disulfide interchange protein DsbD